MSCSLRLLVAWELYFNATFYADHKAFSETARIDSQISQETVFDCVDRGDLSYTQIKIKSEVVKAEAEARNCDQYSDQCDQNTIFNNIENVTLQRMDFKALSVQWIPNFKSDFIYTY